MRKQQAGKRQRKRKLLGLAREGKGFRWEYPMTLREHFESVRDGHGPGGKGTMWCKHDACMTDVHYPCDARRTAEAALLVLDAAKSAYDDAQRLLVQAERIMEGK